MDIVDANTRSRMMRGITGKNTKPEKLVRSYLHRRGFRFRIHTQVLISKPDIVLARYGVVVFVHGCFWHRHTNCKLAYTPKSRREFWEDKLSRNLVRDEESHSALLDAG